jgi:hypothetical protein
MTTETMGVFHMLRSAESDHDRSPRLPLPEQVDDDAGAAAAGAALARWQRELQGGLGAAITQLERAGLPPELLATVRNQLYTECRTRQPWLYSMISQEHLEKALGLIDQMENPYLSLRAFNLIIARLERDNTMVPFTYKSLAEALGASRSSGSTVLNDLARANILIRRRHAGVVTYHVNENVAFCGNLTKRRHKARTAPQLDMAV